MFNRKLIGETLALQVPDLVKFEVVSDPTKIRSVIPREFLAPVVATVVDSIRQTFVVGLVCAVCCAVAAGFVPFKRLMEDQKDPEPQDTELITVVKRMSLTPGSVLAASSNVVVDSARRFSKVPV